MCESALIEILHEIFREKDVECPIDCDAHFLFHARQLAPVNSAPEKPGEKSGEIDAENPRHSRAPTDRRQQTERFETEWLLRFPVNARHDVVRDNFSFARSVLGGRRTKAAGRGVRHERAIAQRLETVNAFNIEVLVSFNRSALLRTAAMV